MYITTSFIHRWPADSTLRWETPTAARSTVARTTSFIITRPLHRALDENSYEFQIDISESQTFILISPRLTTTFPRKPLRLQEPSGSDCQTGTHHHNQAEYGGAVAGTVRDRQLSELPYDSSGCRYGWTRGTESVKFLWLQTAYVMDLTFLLSDTEMGSGYKRWA